MILSDLSSACRACSLGVNTRDGYQFTKLSIFRSIRKLSISIRFDIEIGSINENIDNIDKTRKECINSIDMSIEYRLNIDKIYLSLSFFYLISIKASLSQKSSSVVNYPARCKYAFPWQINGWIMVENVFLPVGVF